MKKVVDSIKLFFAVLFVLIGMFGFYICIELAQMFKWLYIAGLGCIIVLVVGVWMLSGRDVATVESEKIEDTAETNKTV